MWLFLLRKNSPNLARVCLCGDANVIPISMSVGCYFHAGEMFTTKTKKSVKTASYTKITLLSNLNVEWEILFNRLHMINEIEESLRLLLDLQTRTEDGERLTSAGCLEELIRHWEARIQITQVKESVISVSSLHPLWTYGLGLKLPRGTETALGSQYSIYADTSSCYTSNFSVCPSVR